MKITVLSSKAVKPDYGGGDTPAAAAFVPLTVFDLISFDDYMFGIHAFHPPSPPAAALEAGLARALAEYREWAGRLHAEAATGRRGILLNDAGARLVEAAAADGATRDEYHLTPKGSDLRSQVMLLNGKALATGADGSIPRLEAVKVDAAQPIAVAPYSLVFARISHFHAPACS